MRRNLIMKAYYMELTRKVETIRKKDGDFSKSRFVTFFIFLNLHCDMETIPPPSGVPCVAKAMQ